MFKTTLIAAACIGAIGCCAAFADDIAHKHEPSILGTHTHVVNGTTVTHRHAQADTVAGQLEGLNRRFQAKETISRSRYQVGAGFGPYSVAEYQARKAAGQPGLIRIQEPWPGRRYRNQD